MSTLRDYLLTLKESDNIAQSVTLSLSSNTSDDECGELSDAGSDDAERRHKKNVPFGGYRKGRHTRSKTDPFRMHRAKAASKSPRYHSDPAGGDSTTSSGTVY